LVLFVAKGTLHSVPFVFLVCMACLKEGGLKASQAEWQGF
jgi:hypothetical protein